MLIVTAVIATTIDTPTRVPINPFNFFGYFTIQSNLIMAAVFLAVAVRSFRGLPDSQWLQLARACATSYMVVVGIVYALLLAPLGAAGGVPLPWANTVLHVVVPIYAVVDWIVIGDRRPVSYRYLWVAAVYPLLWCGVVLVRGATDGWVPYPFLDQGNGMASVLTYVALIAATVIGVAALIFWASRMQGVASRSGRM